MKIFLLLLVIAVLSGCTSTITNQQIDIAVKNCELNGGLSHIKFVDLNSVSVCKNDAVFTNTQTRFR